MLQILSAIFAFGAAIFWLLASIGRDPSNILRGIQVRGGPQFFGGDQVETIKAIIKQSRLNAWAAICAAVAAVTQGVSILLPH